MDGCLCVGSHVIMSHHLLGRTHATYNNDKIMSKISVLRFSHTVRGKRSDYQKDGGNSRFLVNIVELKYRMVIPLL